MTASEINRVVRDHVGPAEADWVTLAQARRKLREVRQRLDRLAAALEAPFEHARFLAESAATVTGWDLYVLDHIARIGAALECHKQLQKGAPRNEARHEASPQRPLRRSRARR